MTLPVDHAAEALLSAAVDEAGDLLAAFTRLCAGTSIGDVEGETYRAALERVIRQFGAGRLARGGIRQTPSHGPMP